MKKLIYLIPPILLIILLFPVEWAGINSLFHGDFSMFLDVLPIYIPFLTFPAYYYVVVYDVDKKTVNDVTRWWVRISFILAMVPYVYVPIALWSRLPIVIPFALLFLFIYAQLLYRFEQNK